MILAFDTYYFGDKQARTIAILFDNWKSDEIYKYYELISDEVADYESGSFYKRELPCILDLFKEIQKMDEIKYLEAIIIDGYVCLDDDSKPGLGAKLFETLGGNYPVVGVAKSNFFTLNKNKELVYRGESKHPLYVSSIGIELKFVCQKIEEMFGEYRIPHLLKLLDMKTKL